MLTNARDGRTLKATVYLPVRKVVSKKEFPEKLVAWYSTYSVTIGGETFKKKAAGDDWLQALLMAVEGIRLHIPKHAEKEWETPSGVHAWLVFPTMVPSSWGFEHFAKMRDHIDKATERISSRARRKAGH